MTRVCSANSKVPQRKTTDARYCSLFHSSRLPSEEQGPKLLQSPVENGRTRGRGTVAYTGLLHGVSAERSIHEFLDDADVPARIAAVQLFFVGDRLICVDWRCRDFLGTGMVAASYR